MNRFGRTVMKHWRENGPEKYAEIDHPEAYFTALGEQIAEEIDAMARAMAGETSPDESYPDRVARLNTARFEAEAEVMRRYLLADRP